MKFINQFIIYANNEIASLLSQKEGYLIVTKWFDKKTNVYFVKLKHKANRNIISIIANEREFIMKKNGKIIKTIPPRIVES